MNALLLVTFGALRLCSLLNINVISILVVEDEQLVHDSLLWKGGRAEPIANMRSCFGLLRPAQEILSLFADRHCSGLVLEP
jgi:hypothetical protein